MDLFDQKEKNLIQELVSKLSENENKENEITFNDLFSFLKNHGVKFTRSKWIFIEQIMKSFQTIKFAKAIEQLEFFLQKKLKENSSLGKKRYHPNFLRACRIRNYNLIQIFCLKKGQYYLNKALNFSFIHQDSQLANLVLSIGDPSFQISIYHCNFFILMIFFLKFF